MHVHEQEAIVCLLKGQLALCFAQTTDAEKHRREREVLHSQRWVAAVVKNEWQRRRGEITRLFLWSFRRGLRCFWRFHGPRFNNHVIGLKMTAMVQLMEITSITGKKICFFIEISSMKKTLFFDAARFHFCPWQDRPLFSENKIP